MLKLIFGRMKAIQAFALAVWTAAQTDHLYLVEPRLLLEGLDDDIDDRFCNMHCDQALIVVSLS